MDPFIDPETVEETDFAAHLLSRQAGLYVSAWESDQRELTHLRSKRQAIPKWWERGEAIIFALLAESEESSEMYSALCYAIDRAVIDGDTARRSDDA